MLSLDSWKHHTAGVAPGRSVRVDHDCGGGRTLKVEHRPDGFSAYCWRCADKGWLPHEAPSLSERLSALARTREADLAAGASVELPQPAVRDPQQWPMAARVWLYKAGLSNDDIESLRFYYCPPMKRVVMPVTRDGQPAYWQARGFDTTRPKYLNPVVSDKPLAKFGSGPVLVMTEDILSAIKVGRVTQAWCITGTSLSAAAINEIVRERKPVGIMLDPDAAGVRARSKALRALSLVGIDARIIRASRDPKLLSAEEIRSCLRSSFPQFWPG